MNLSGVFSTFSDWTGISQISKWFSEFGEDNLVEFAALLRKEWPDCPPSIQTELDMERPPNKGKIHHHLVAMRNNPALALEHLKLIMSIRDAFREHVVSGTGSNYARFDKFRAAIFAPQADTPTPGTDVVKEFCHGKIGLVGASQNGGVTYHLFGRLHLPTEAEGGFPRESSIRVGALVLARLSMVSFNQRAEPGTTEEVPPPQDINCVVDLADCGMQNLDRGFGISMGELIRELNLREGDEALPSAPCVRFRKMICINANWLYTTVWHMVRPFIPQEWLDVISFETPDRVGALVHLPSSSLPSSLGGDIPVETLLSPTPTAEEPPSRAAGRDDVEDAAVQPRDVRETAEDPAAAKGDAGNETSSPSEASSQRPEEGKEEPAAPGAATGAPADSDAAGGEGWRAAAGALTPRWFVATMRYFVHPPPEWHHAVPSLDAAAGLAVAAQNSEN